LFTNGIPLVYYKPVKTSFN